MTSVRAGDVIADKYRVERLLGAGGMGAVYAARHLELDQPVAIKFLSASALGDAEAHARFKQEAKAAVRLKGDHVAQVYDVGVHGDEAEPFIVMEYLEGQDLSALLKKASAVSVPEAVEYVLQACEALAEAHAIGIVHRDIKLANLFVTRGPGGRPLLKLLDFGISKNLSPDAAFDVTNTSAMLGSPKFMSPEQMRDPKTVDARTDIWSLGVVLYRLVSGQAPFEAETIARLCTMVLAERPAPLRTLCPALPAGFETIVDACLEKDRMARLPTVAHLAAALVPYAVDPEAARERAEVVASVLAMPLPPLGAPPPVTAASAAFDGAWSSTHAGPGGTLVLPPPAAPRAGGINPLFASIAALGAALLFATFMVVRSHDVPESTAAPVEPPPSAVVAPPPPAPSLAAAPSSEASANAVADAPGPDAHEARHPAATPPRRPAGARQQHARPDGLPLPGDRK